MVRQTQFAITARPHSLRRAVAVFVGVVCLAGCGGNAGPSAGTTDTRGARAVDDSPTASVPQGRLVVGAPEPGLAFTVSSIDADSGFSGASSGPALPDATTGAAQNATEAVSAFGQAIVDGRPQDAFALLPEVEQTRIGSPTRFADVLSREPSWLSSSLDAAPSADGVASIRVVQTPVIDEIRGVVGSSALVALPVRKEPSGWKVSWERRSVTQQFDAAERQAEGDVIAWADARQKNCSVPRSDLTAVPAGEHTGGLLGALWLTDQICTTPGPVSVVEVGDIYTLDDPQALLDAYGSGAYQWARVVTLAAPHAMHVIVAPLADRWVVVGIAPVPARN